MRVGERKPGGSVPCSDQHVDIGQEEKNRRGGSLVHAARVVRAASRRPWCTMPRSRRFDNGKSVAAKRSPRARDEQASRQGDAMVEAVVGAVEEAAFIRCV